MLCLDKNILTQTKKNIQQKMRSLIQGTNNLKRVLKIQEEESLLTISSKQIQKLRSPRSSIPSSLGLKNSKMTSNYEMKLKAERDTRTHEPITENLKTPPKMKIEFSTSSTSNFMNMFTNPENTNIHYHHQRTIPEKPVHIDSSEKRLKYPKPKLKFPIPDKQILMKMISKNSSRQILGSAKKPPDRTTTGKRKELSSDIFKGSKVSQLKLKVKTIKRIINHYENNITSICKEFGENPDENGKNFNICKEKWKKLKVVHRRNFVYLSHNYEGVNGITSDIVAVCLLLYSAIKVGISGSLFVKAAKYLSKKRIDNVNQVRESEEYKVVKSVLKRE